LSSFFAPLLLPRSPNVPPLSDDATHVAVIFFFFIMTLRPLLPQPQSSLPRDVE
jgi:hypothetical protein